MGRSWSRLALLTGLALLPAACDGQPDESAADDGEIVEVTVSCAPTLSTLPREYAMRAGIDRDNGLEIVCVQAQSGPEVAAALISGEMEIVQMVPANLFTLLEQGADVVAFLPVLDREAGDLVVRSDFPLPHSAEGWAGVMRDLQDASIGVTARGAAAEDLARGLFIAAGLDPDRATYIATGLPTTTLAALGNAEVDAAVVVEPGITVALEEAIGIQPFSLQELTGPASMDWGSLMYVSTRTFAEENIEVLTRFVRTWREALDWLQDPANRAEAIELASDYLGVDPSLAEALFMRNVSFWSDSPGIEPGRFDAVGDFYRDIGRFETAYHVEDYGFVVDE